MGKEDILESGVEEMMNPKLASAKDHRLVIEIAQTAILTLLIFLSVRVAVQNFTIDGTSMEPGLHNAELVLVDKLTYLFHTPARGDVVVFKAPPDPSQDYVKRVIGEPGDVITVRGTTIVVDGVTLSESYLDPANQGEPAGAHDIMNAVVPPNEYFVLGDNRAVSSDSRIWGFVPKQYIIGRAAFVYWPLGKDNDGFLPGVSSVFAAIHQNNNQDNGPLNAITANINALWLLSLPVLVALYMGRKTLKRVFLPSSTEKAESGL
jgi:signal peptidase I